MGINAIQCREVSKSYGKHHVLNGIDFTVPAGSFFGLVGMNGSGKSTMIKAILDLISIERGHIELFGKSHRKVNAREQVAYLPDRFSPPIHLKGKDFIQYMLELHASKKSKAAIYDMLDALELGRNTMESSVRSLSKGMTQKLGLASCLLSNKSLLILDEPMSGLDPKARVLFKQQLFRLKQQGVTLFFSSHVLADVDEMADKMAVLHKSKILFEGSSSDFKQKHGSDTLEQAYINCIDVVE
ncbi:MAG: ABC transporter ATP-binding protein [Thiotrichales bacterium]|nr:MAG: ABC transporter ATP-binding protein [Thiotrichales bacterium]